MAKRPAKALPVEAFLEPSEEILAERIDAAGVRFVVTSHGRKVAVDPDGTLLLLVGPPLVLYVPPAPGPEADTEAEPEAQPEPAPGPEPAGEENADA